MVEIILQKQTFPKAQNFFKICEAITKNWNEVRDKMLIGCHDPYPSTDVVYGLAYRIIDPTQKELIEAIEKAERRIKREKKQKEKGNLNKNK